MAVRAEHREPCSPGSGGAARRGKASRRGSLLSSAGKEEWTPATQARTCVPGRDGPHYSKFKKIAPLILGPAWKCLSEGNAAGEEAKEVAEASRGLCGLQCSLDWNPQAPGSQRAGGRLL